MSDPFERLASSASFDAPVDVDAIRARARTIQRRRQTGIASAGVTALAVIAVVGVLLATNPGAEKSTSLAESAQEATPTPRKLAMRQLAPSEVQAGKSESSSGAVGGGAASGGSAVAPAAGQSTTADSAVAAPAPTPKELDATLEVEDQTLSRGKTFTLKVCNVTSGTVKRSFSSSQRYDFEVSKDGEVVWRWSNGQFFTQVIGEETWKAKECKTWSEDWNATNNDGTPVASDTYDAVGILNASPELQTSTKNVTVSAL
jgi:intracellular proteinase inhibitor BsuPI